MGGKGPFCLLLFPLAAAHRFQADESDWGFSKFTQLKDMTYAAYEQDRPIIENGAATFTVLLRVVKDPTGVLWHNFIK